MRLEAKTATASTVLDGDAAAGLSPVQSLCAALAGCMAMDVVHVLTKARLPLTGLEVQVDATRAPGDPRRVIAVALHFRVEGAVPLDRVEHALSLSRETYCSVWHSLNPDITLTTSAEVLAQP